MSDPLIGKLNQRLWGPLRHLKTWSTTSTSDVCTALGHPSKLRVGLVGEAGEQERDDLVNVALEDTVRLLRKSLVGSILNSSAPRSFSAPHRPFAPIAPLPLDQAMAIANHARVPIGDVLRPRIPLSLSVV